MSGVRNSLLAAAAFLSTAGCGDPSGPAPFSGTYVLAAIDGAEDPLVTVDHAFTSGERLVQTVQYDTVTFTSRTTARRSESVQSIRFAADGTPLQVNAASAVYHGDVQSVDDGVVVQWMTPRGPTEQRLEYRARTLRWRTMIGIVCTEGCPAPRSVEFTYERS